MKKPLVEIMKYDTEVKEMESFKAEIETVSGIPFDEYFLHAIDHQRVREAIMKACYEDNGVSVVDSSKRSLDDLFEFNILKFITKENEVFYQLFGYSETGDEVDFGGRSTLKEIAELLEFYSQLEPDFQVIHEGKRK